MAARASLVLSTLLLLPASAGAAVLTVGSGGAYATVQAAIDDAMATPADDELRLRAGSFTENLTIGDVDLGGRLEISGGWDAAFATRDPDPLATVLDGGGTDRVFYAPFVDNGELVLRGLTLRNGLAAGHGGALYLFAADIAVAVEDCRFELNLATTTDGGVGAQGGGALIGAGGAAQVRLAGVVFEDNEVFIDDTVGAPLGGGARISATGTSSVLLRHASVLGNRLEGGSQRRGGGLSLDVAGSATIEAEDLFLFANSGDIADAGEVQSHALDVTADDSGVVTLRRVEIRDNTVGAGDESPQVGMNLFGGTVRFTDSLVAGGAFGIVVSTVSALVEMNHLTLTDHVEEGAYVFAGSPGSATVTNTIAWDNGNADLSLTGGASSGSHNLIGIDPLFVNAAAGDYRLGALSTAIDAGTAAPAGGLGPFDLAHAERVVGSLPDIGAYERQSLFGDDFERGDARAWSATAP